VSGPRARSRRSSAPRCCSSRRARAERRGRSGSRRRRPRSSGGIVKVDGRQRTREPLLYAIGDIVGGLQLAHTAAHEGIVAAHVIAGEQDVHPVDYVKQPRATIARPEIASVGLTEQQCEERGIPVKIGKVPFQAIAKALIGGEYEGFAKVIANKDTDITLGIHLIGPHATDLIAEASVAFELEARPGRSAGRPIRTRPVGDHGRGRDERRRAVSINF
jgi:dihydrolipoamide dehydrogenase